MRDKSIFSYIDGIYIGTVRIERAVRVRDISVAVGVSIRNNIDRAPEGVCSKLLGHNAFIYFNPFGKIDRDIVKLK